MKPKYITKECVAVLNRTLTRVVLKQKNGALAIGAVQNRTLTRVVLKQVTSITNLYSVFYRTLTRVVLKRRSTTPVT